MKKRIISMLLVLLMVLSTASTCVFATADQVSDSTEVTTNDLNVESTEPLNAGTEDGDAGAVEDTEPAEFKVDSVVANGENGAVVKWSGAPEGSTVLITPVNGSTEGQAQSFSGSAGTASVTGLKAGTTYTFKVDVVDETGASIIQGDPIITPSITTDAAKIIPGKFLVGTYSAYNSVAIDWSPSNNAVYYRVYKDGKLVADKVTSRSVFDPNYFSYICTGINDDSAHRFQIEAVSSDGSTTKSAVVSDARVSRMYIRITFKQKKTLKSHDGSNTKYTFKKGQTVYAFGFGSGQYYFTYNVGGRDHTFYVNYGRVRKPQALYTTSFNYSQREAEYFVATAGRGSSTNHMIWANLYTQHIYLFTRVNGLWRVNGGTYSDWECSSGKASSPSPTGLSFTIKNKYKRHSSTRFWNTYKGQAAIHGQVNNSYGRPLSHGCIRNPNAKAEFIFKYYPKKTRVMVY